MTGALAAAAQAAPAAFVPCINQRTTLPAPFRKACEASASTGFRHVELWLARLREEGIAAREAAEILKQHWLTALCACSAAAKLSAPEFQDGEPAQVARRCFQALGRYTRPAAG